MGVLKELANVKHSLSSEPAFVVSDLDSNIT